MNIDINVNKTFYLLEFDSTKSALYHTVKVPGITFKSLQLS